jgi:peptide/nickel transport system substrate-binding protein
MNNDQLNALYMIRRRQLLMGVAASALAGSLLPGMAFAQDATEIAPATPLADLPRTAQLILGWSMTSPIGVTNPWAVPGYTHQEGNALMWEPLMYFGIFKNEYIPWLATSIEYTNADFTVLQIKLNQKAKWSDGKPVTSKDVVFTFEGQLKNAKLPYHAAFEQFMESATAVDDLTVDVKFKIPAPRFKFEVLCLKFDTGIPIVPSHALEGAADVNAVTGGVEMPHSGPYDLVAWNANQKIFNLRESWWAVEAGVATMPDVKRVVMVQLGGQVGQNMDTIAQRLVNNEMDSALDMRSSVIGNILAQNTKITTHTANESPYGYLDWWPNSLWMNTKIAPFNDARVRRAISLSVNRDKIDEVLYEGAKISTIYPFPLYPGLQTFVDSPEVKAVESALQPRAFDTAQAAALMTEAGYKMNAKNLWEKDGATVNCTIHGFEGIHSDIVPVLVEFLLASGFDASVNFGSNAYQSMSDGAPGLYMFGHGASLRDPYAAFELFHGRFSEAIGTSAGNNRFSRYSNPEYDKVVDAMAPLDSDNPVFKENAVKALEIYWKEQIDVPIIQWLHRIAYNQTYWTNWPTAANVAGGSNGAFWAHTGLLVVTGLKKA